VRAGDALMLRRSVKVQLVLFVILTLVGVSYVSAEYVGLFKGFGKDACTIHAEFPDSGGIFTNAEVTYRGVSIGRVGQLHLIAKGVKVDLHIDNCSNPKIPVSSSATVSDRSVIGEQYVNIIPPNDNGPYVHGGEVITMDRTSVPIATKQLLTDMDALVNSVNVPSLQTTVRELGEAFANKGQALGSLLDSTNNLLVTAQQNLPTTIALIDQAGKVLNTQLQEAQPLQSFTHSLNLLSQQLKASDGDIRNLLDTGPSALSVVSKFVQDNSTDLGVTLANLATVGDLLVRHLDGIEQILEVYPALPAGGLTSLRAGPSCGTGVTCGALGLILQTKQTPPDCGDPNKGQQGYGGTDRRHPNETQPKAPNVAARCTAPASSGVNVRGSQNVPGGDPISNSGGGVAYPRATTENTVRLGDVGSRASILGDRSWIAILTTALN
jgi:phospholipid/cholesterol/gamma-HCH transport system substrate-binding protein